MGSSLAAEPFFVFTNESEQQCFDHLVSEIRCVTCPNQTIADSNAPIARAMKESIYRRLQAGESEAAIRQYLLSNYGEYVSYRPPVAKETWVLWWGPLGMLFIGFFMLRRLR